MINLHSLAALEQCFHDLAFYTTDKCSLLRKLIHLLVQEPLDIRRIVARLNCEADSLLLLKLGLDICVWATRDVDLQYVIGLFQKIVESFYQLVPRVLITLIQSVNHKRSLGVNVQGSQDLLLASIVAQRGSRLFGLLAQLLQSQLYRVGVAR